MNYIVMDLEWNQGSADREKQNPMMPFEVIEIGAVRLSEDGVHTGDFNRLIKPTCYKTMHYITGKLVHIDMEMLQKEDTFPVVMKEFMEWCGEDAKFATWGSLDLTELQRNMTYHGMASLSDGPLPFYDVQKLFSIAYEDRKSRRSLEYAIDFLKLTKDVPFHRAYSDAYYTAEIFAGLDQETLSNFSYDYYRIPESKKEEVHVIFDTYAKYISRGFADKQEALKDREVMSTRCYKCGRSLRKRISWFTPNGKHYYSVSNCPEHGLMKAKLRIRKKEEQVYVVKTEKFISQTELAAIQNREKKAAVFTKKKEAQKNHTN